MGCMPEGLIKAIAASPGVLALMLKPAEYGFLHLSWFELKC